MDTGQDTAPLVALFNSKCGGNYDVADFDAAAGSITMEEFAEQVLTPRPQEHQDVTENELLKIIGLLQRGELSEWERDY